MFNSHLCSDYGPIPSHNPLKTRHGVQRLALLLFLTSILIFYFVIFYWNQTEPRLRKFNVRPESQSTIDQYNLANHGLAQYGVTPIIYQQIEERAAIQKPDLFLSTIDNRGDTFSQMWYDPSNFEHNSKSHKRLRELGVDMEAAKIAFDWTNVHGFCAMTPVRDQGRTGTCWTFASTSVSEHAWWLAGNELEPFSPQVLADCLSLTCEGEHCNEDRTAAIDASHMKDVKACFNGDCNFNMFDNFPYCEEAPFSNKGCGVRNGWGGGAAIDAFRYYWHKGFVKAEEYPFRICASHDWEYRHRDLNTAQRKEVCLESARYCSWDESMTYPFSKCILGLPVSMSCQDHKAEKPIGKISGAFLVSESYEPTIMKDEIKNGESKSMYFQGKMPSNAVSEERMKDALLNVGPLTIGITSNAMHYYQGGILDLPDELCPNADEGDHAITLVGYGEENGVKYWKIQNSWGELWGEKGFARLARGKNTCGIANSVQAAYV